MVKKARKIVIIGGGITALTAGYYIKQYIDTHELPYDLQILESSARVGGKINTVKIDGKYIERGASFINGKIPHVMKLIEALGMEHQVMTAESKQQAVLLFGKLHHLPYPNFMGIPFKIHDIWKTDMLSFKGKLCVYKDLFFRKNQQRTETTIYDFLENHFGSEMMDHIIEPYLSSLLSVDISEVGVTGEFSFLLELEKQYGSLIKGLAQMNYVPRSETIQYLTFETGLEAIIEELKAYLKPHIQYGKKVYAIKKGLDHQYVLNVNENEEIMAAEVCIAIPNTEFKYLLPDEELLSLFSQHLSVPQGTVTLSFPKEAIKSELVGSGFVTPSKSDSHITSSMWLTNIWSHVTSKDEVLIRAFIGRYGEIDILSLSDSQLEYLVLEDLKKLLVIEGKPNFSVVARWQHSIPLSPTKYLKERMHVHQVLREKYPGIFINEFGASIGASVEQGEVLAQSLIEYIQQL
ncbi:protoporphyrinogen oxidase [Isobaculum melis]|uniref:Coproporphyrinogen III oxidase n=1 Tax=Isobaculum melis TaxID=142588 RepID=A0A1H9QJE5_9LACT|nr:protoporphyrinogen oxidase [Isobaculum melis]SER60626.1 oxygen-dependent protoporphyrinogen oxidase [Isobaculum melis]